MLSRDPNARESREEDVEDVEHPCGGNQASPRGRRRSHREGGRASTSLVFVPRRGARRPTRSPGDGEVSRPALPLAEAARKCPEVRASLSYLRTVQAWVFPTSRSPEAATTEETIRSDNVRLDGAISANPHRE
jgi:hypothetical protein